MVEELGLVGFVAVVAAVADAEQPGAVRGDGGELAPQAFAFEFLDRHFRAGVSGSDAPHGV